MERKKYTLPERAKDRRKELGLTLLQVAKRVGVTEATVQRWESGKIKSLQYDNIIKLAYALDTTPAFLMGWEKKESDSVRKKLIEFVEHLPDEQLDLYLTLSQYPTEKLQAIVDLLK
jgi:transcriptional regulator with XRE-family HTH domain